MDIAPNRNPTYHLYLKPETGQKTVAILELNDNLGATVNNCSSGAFFYTCIDILLALDKITYFQHLQREVVPAHAGQLHASFSDRGFDYIRGLLSVPPLHSACEPLYLFKLLEMNEQNWGLSDGGGVGVVES